MLFISAASGVNVGVNWCNKLRDKKELKFPPVSIATLTETDLKLQKHKIKLMKLHKLPKPSNICFVPALLKILSL